MEIANLRWAPDDESVNDVDTDWGQIRVLGKGRRERLVPLGKSAKAEINRYLIARHSHRHADLPWLWVARKVDSDGAASTRW